MTTSTASRPLPPTTTLDRSRLVSVARVHTSAIGVLVGMPLMILAVATCISVAITAALGANGINSPNGSVSGAVVSVYIAGIFFYAQAMAATFPFALGLGATRREFFTATALLAVVQATAFGTLLFVLALIEKATNGFGVRTVMFRLADTGLDRPALLWAVLVVGFVVAYAAGLLGGAVFGRWRVTGVVVAGTALGVVGASLLTLILWRQWWRPIGAFFSDAPLAVTTIVFPLAVAAALAAAGWSVMRRTTA